MNNIKNRLAGIKKRLSKYSIEYNDFSDEDLLYDGEEYEDLSEVMTSQRDGLEDIYCEIDAILEESSGDEQDTIQEIKEAVHEALCNIEAVASKASCPWLLDRPEYDTEVTEAIDRINDALSKLEEL